jgi:hypothetical protein
MFGLYHLPGVWRLRLAVSIEFNSVDFPKAEAEPSPRMLISNKIWVMDILQNINHLNILNGLNFANSSVETHICTINTAYANIVHYVQ